MAEYFFNRHNANMEGFAPLDSMESTTALLLSDKPASCPSTLSTIADITAYNAENAENAKNSMFQNAQCALEAEHQTYLEKIRSDTITVGVTNDVSEKMSKVHMKTWHLLFGTGLMLAAVYTLTTSE